MPVASAPLVSISTLPALDGLRGHVAIGHTRWATHGAPTTTTSAPAHDREGRRVEAADEPALADPEITVDQRTFVKEFIRRIKSRVRL